MAVRLLALVMLPVTVMCALGGTVVMTHREAARHASAVDQGVVELGHLVALRDAIHSEQSANAFTARVLEFGVTIAEASQFLGFDWSSQVAPARARAFDAVAHLGSATPVSRLELQSLYRRIDANPEGSDAQQSELDGMIATLASATTRRLDRLYLEAGGDEIVQALRALRITNEIVLVVTPLVIDLSAVWFPSPKDSPADSAGALARLVSESAAYKNGLGRLHDLGSGDVLEKLREIESNANVGVLDDAVAATISGRAFTAAGEPIDDAAVSSALRGHFVLRSLLDELVASATGVVQDEAGPLAASERRTYVQWTFGFLAVALGSIVIALRMARSISEPLEDLARYAHAVNEGDLDATLASRLGRGPRETRMTRGVFTDLVTNLKLLDAKANALAQCDFDDPALLAPLPGRLGLSLHNSVALLSGSIVERDELQTHLAHEATHDSLTGIGNRAAALSGIRGAISRAARSEATTALLFLDLNSFKAVNDSHGHEVGDEVLRHVAQRVTACLRDSDLAARLGGDEFVVIAENLDGVVDAELLARRIIDAISRPIIIGSLHLVVGAAVGIALTQDAVEEPLRLLDRADAAMYRAKKAQRSGIEVFDAELQLQLDARADVETALAAHIDDSEGGLHLLFQPVVDACTGGIAGAEALLRWDRPGHGRLAPDAFIPIAEATSLIIDVDCWVLNAATRELVAWSSIPSLAAVPLSVNISGRHLLSRRLPGHVAAALDQSGVDPCRLSIEITETVMLADLALAAEELAAVRALGVKVAIDDFGTGYTSLAHLQELPIDTIKIDRSFISHLDDERGTTLVRMVTDLGHANNLRIVAEGVETAAELCALQDMGADEVQGFLFSRPLEPQALAEWADRHQPGAPTLSAVELCPV